MQRACFKRYALICQGARVNYGCLARLLKVLSMSCYFQIEPWRFIGVISRMVYGEWRAHVKESTQIRAHYAEYQGSWSQFYSRGLRAITYLSEYIYIYITFLDRSYYSFASGHLKSPKKLKFHAVAMTIYLSHQTVTASVWRLCPILIRDRSLRLWNVTFFRRNRNHDRVTCL